MKIVSKIDERENPERSSGHPGIRETASKIRIAQQVPGDHKVNDNSDGKKAPQNHSGAALVGEGFSELGTNHS
jgi:hypothetical protein